MAILPFKREARTILPGRKKRTCTMLTKSLIAVIALTVAAPAFANSGTDQLARQLGVAPGAYTVSQLMQLQSAKDDNDSTRFNFILSQSGVEASRNSSDIGSVNAGAAQIAAQLGVSASAYSLSDLVRLQNAVRDNDSQTVQFILNGSNNGNVSGDVGTVNPGKTQLAAALGVNAADYSTADLASMYLRSID